MPELAWEEESCVLRVGYALPARKIEAFMVPKFIDYAKQRGVRFFPIDVSVPLTDQGPFDCIIHKLYDHRWNLDLQRFALDHPNATVIDPPSAIQRLHNRISMLQPVPQLAIPQLNIPHQILLQNDAVSKLTIPNQNDAVSKLTIPNQNDAVSKLTIPNQNDAVSKLKIGNQILVEDDVVSQLKIQNQILDQNDVVSGLAVPNQILVENDAVSLTATGDLSFPVIAKPLLADGGSNAHDMSIIFNEEGLLNIGLELQPPLILQQFVNHGGIIFKVYVAGDYVECVKRTSLPDVSEETVEKMASECGGVMKFSQISSSAPAPAPAPAAAAASSGGGDVKMPAAEFVAAVAGGLRAALGLHLFNFDMIRDEKRDEYLVIDINYFPGYEKLQSYEMVMTEFFLNIKESQKQKKKEKAAMVDGSQVSKQ